MSGGEFFENVFILKGIRTLLGCEKCCIWCQVSQAGSWAPSPSQPPWFLHREPMGGSFRRPLCSVQSRHGKPASSKQNHRLRVVPGSRGVGQSNLSREPEKEHTLRLPRWVLHSGKTWGENFHGTHPFMPRSCPEMIGPGGCPLSSACRWQQNNGASNIGFSFFVSKKILRHCVQLLKLLARHPIHKQTSHKPFIFLLGYILNYNCHVGQCGANRKIAANVSVRPL